MRVMIKLLVIMVLVIVWSGPALGIDKSRKKDENPKDRKTVQTEKTKPVQTSAQRDSQRSEIKKPAKGFDDFIDRNNNGIDDRVEKKPPKQAPAQPKPEGASPKNPKP